MAFNPLDLAQKAINKGQEFAGDVTEKITGSETAGKFAEGLLISPFSGDLSGDIKNLLSPFAGLMPKSSKKGKAKQKAVLDVSKDEEDIEKRKRELQESVLRNTPGIREQSVLNIRG